MDTSSENKSFSISKRAKSFVHAGRGVWLFLKDTHNAWLHVAAFVIVILLGCYFGISRTEWISLMLACGLVFVSEAGAVLLSTVFAVMVGVLIFWPYVVKI